MQTSSNWYHDDNELLSTLKRSRVPVSSIPRIGGYDDFQEVARGGQGAVYSATQQSTHRRVAIKVLIGGAIASESARQRFMREIDLAASLRHQNVVRLYDSGITQDGHPFFIMEFIDGSSLDDLIQSPDGNDQGAGPAFGSVETSLKMFVKICDAVAYAHQRGVIHRDIKPSNIRIDATGEPHVLDFGLAKSVGDDRSSESPMSITGQFMGSLPWASPEQAEGRPDKVDVRTDVYSLGVVLYQMLTGRFPYQVTGSFREVIENIMTTIPTPPQRHTPSLDQDVETIVMKCLEKDSAGRYQSAVELARDVRRCLAGEPIEARRDSAWYTLSKRMRRYRMAMALSVAAILVLGSGAVAMSVLWLNADSAQRQANSSLKDAELARQRESEARERAVDSEQKALAALSETESARQLEAEARQREETARQSAEDAAAKMERINHVLVNLLASPVERGKDARVVDLLEQALDEADVAFKDDPEIEGIIRDTVGSGFASLGQYDDARRELDKALALLTEHKGADDEATLNALSHKAWLCKLIGEMDESERLYRESLAGRARAFGDGDFRTYRAMNDLALLLEMRGKYDEALELAEVSAAGIARELGEDSRDALHSQNNVASMLHAVGRYDEAEKIMRRQVDRMVELYGERDMGSLSCMNSLAVLLIDMGQHAEAEQLARRVYSINLETQGPDHMQTLLSLSAVASALSQTNRSEECIALYRQVADGFERTLGPDHPYTTTSMRNLGNTLQLMGATDEAEAILRRVVEIRERTLGASDPETLVALNSLAVTLHGKGEFLKAREIYERLYQGMLKARGEEHPDTISAMSNLGISKLETNDVAEGEKLIQRVYDLRRRVLGDDHPNTIVTWCDVVRIKADHGDNAGAATELLDVIAAAERVMGSDYWYTYVLRGYRGECLTAAGQAAEAEPILLESQEHLSTVMGPENRFTVKAIERLIACYEALDRPEEAATWRTKLPGADSAAEPMVDESVENEIVAPAADE